MKFSVAFSFVAPPGSSTTHIGTFREFKALTPYIEELGYHGIHMTEHHFQVDGFLPSPLLVLAQAAGQTKRVKLATNILVSTLYKPVQLLEDLATLDNLSDGRLIFGTSPGYVSEEFKGRGIEPETRFKLHEEIIDFIQHAWAHPEDIAWRGKMFEVPSVRLAPAPVQKTLPLWYGVSGPKLLEKAARRRAVLTASPRHTTDELVAHFGRYMEIAKTVGFVPKERPIFRDGIVLDTMAEAERFGSVGTDGLFGIYGRKSAQGERALQTDTGSLVTDAEMAKYKLMASRYIIGDPALAREKIASIRDALNPTEIVMRMQMPDLPTDKLRQSLKLFAEQVMPHFA
jgi:alkanesulfonate monooxygenase SsuD/methylene tetrahydromethanopterin reductase-like flavin-dependent oxidoreductase (luciferase family)